MEIILGLLIIALGSVGQSSSYVPIKRVKGWSWESFWLVQGVFAWIIFPTLGALLAVPETSSLSKLLLTTESVDSIIYGVLWGIGGLSFGLSMRYLGVSLGQSISLGTCSAFGTLLPAIFSGGNLLEGDGLILLIGVSITLAGIAVIGYAGSLRARSMSEEDRKAAIKEFALTKGILVALLAGVMSACFALGLDAGGSIKQAIIDAGVKPLVSGLPVILLVTIGGFLSNSIYCIYQNMKNGTGKEYFRVPTKVILQNILFCALAGGLWYSQFFGLELGKSYLTSSPMLLAFSWSILMSLNVIFSNVWGVILKEWKGSSSKTYAVLIVGIIVLIISVFFPSLF